MTPIRKEVLPAEERAARQRVLKEASNRLVIGPGQAFSAGIAAVFSIGCCEGFLQLQPITATTATTITTTQRLRFVVRYGLAQIIPSVIWGQQKASTIIAAYGLSPHLIFDKLPPRRDLAVNRCLSMRGAIAGTVLISQVFSIVDVSNQAKEAYSNNILAGREPPLLVENPNSKNEGVVIRLAGKVSDATLLGMSREGRRHLFPIFEESKLPEIQHLLREHGVKRGNQHVVPLFWQVNDGQYGHPESWQGMTIPSHWLFDLEQQPQTNNNNNMDEEQEDPPTKMLVLEADATSAVRRSLSLTLPGQHEAANVLDLDLDLYEVAQGFYQLQSLVTKDAPKHKVLRVLLADANAVIKYGGGRATTVRDYVTNLGLADVIIDARVPFRQALLKWLEEQRKQTLVAGSTNTNTNIRPMLGQDSSPSFWWNGLLKWMAPTTTTPAGAPQLQKSSKHKHKKNIVVLETPEELWFQTISESLGKHGYSVCDLSEAMELYGSLDGIPILVYERTTQDTIHTIRRLVIKNIVQPENVCAICPSHRGLIECSDEDDKEGEKFKEIANVCTSDVYDRLLRQVRVLALKGHSNEEIQQILDDNDGTFVDCKARTGSDNQRLCVHL